MPPTPVDDHTEEFEQLAGLASLDVLDGEEKARFDEHAAHCERCRLMVRLDREALALAAPAMDPSPDFKARLLQRAAQELADAEAEVEAEVLPPNVIPMLRWRAPRWASALAAVLVLGLVAVGGYSYQNQVVATYALSGSVPGTAVVNVRRSGAAELEMRGVAAPPPGRVYEGWIIPAGSAPIPVGVTPTGDGVLPLNSVAPGVTVAVTVEPSRVEAPTGPVVLQVQL
jgi:anti-sigma-K factor RskA